MRILITLVSLSIACGEEAGPTGGSASQDGAGPVGGSNVVGGGGATSSDGGHSQAGGSGTGGEGGGGVASYAVETALISDQHRFIDGAMFGGWGPHLGHLIELPSGVFLVDDVCSQPRGSSLLPCDASDDHTVGYYRRGPSGWALVTTQALPGLVQQNTATIASADGSALHTFGVDVAAGKIQECTFIAPAGVVTCAELPFTLAPGSNYIGAALSPLGHRLVWWTTVVDGGGGSFHYIVDYGSGWNGPRSGDVAGYNDASYINIAFPSTTPATFVMHSQLVAGLAPNWTFTGAIGVGSLTTSDPVVWSVPLASVGGTDPIASTNDIWIDPVSNDEHVIARAASGAAAYFHRPASGSWTAAAFVLDQSFRARLIPHGDRVALAYGLAGAGLAFRVATEADRTPGSPIDWGALGEQAVALPDGYGDLYAIYPAGPPYQLAPGSAIELALVGAERQFEVLGVTLTPP